MLCYFEQLSQRLKQFKDELLNSALTFVLSLPSQIASDILPSLVSSLKVFILLNIGCHSYNISMLYSSTVALKSDSFFSRSIAFFVIINFFGKNQNIFPSIRVYICHATNSFTREIFYLLSVVQIAKISVSNKLIVAHKWKVQNSLTK